MTRVLALIVAYNEADVIDATLRGLVEQGCEAYVIDHGSTDGTGDIARSWLHRGVVGVERFPEDSGFPARNAETMVWADLLRRRQQLVQEHDADWYVLNDADEFREAPWPGLTLAEGFAHADGLGYNAVNFRVLNFRPTGPGFEPGDDPRASLTRYEPADVWDAPQIKAFKRPPGALDILTHGGHDVRFAGRRVCPVPFILRHYPIRSPQHGARKVLRERLPRFAPEERQAGWHVQYDSLVEDGSNFTWNPSELEVWDPYRVRAELLGHAADAILVSAHSRGADLSEVVMPIGALRAWVQRRLDLEVDEGSHRAAVAMFERIVNREDLGPLAAQELEVAPLVLSLLDAFAAQLEVAGRITELTAIVDARRRYVAALERTLQPIGFPGARSFVAYLEAEEAVAAPQLVAAFATAFDGDCDATLVLGGVGWSDERIAQELGGLLETLGISGPGAPDLLAVSAVPDDLANLVDVVLSDRPARPALEAVAHLGANGSDALRELAQRAAVAA